MPWNGLTNLVLALLHVVATAAAVTVEDGATTARSLPPHRHCNYRLRPRHHPVCWRGPRPLPLNECHLVFLLDYTKLQ
jgi:hypothetical protein